MLSHFELEKKQSQDIAAIPANDPYGDPGDGPYGGVDIELTQTPKMTNKPVPRYLLAQLRQITDHGDAAILLNQIAYWEKKATIIIPGTGEKPWIAKTGEEWAAETGMKYRTFRTAYEHLLKLELIEVRSAKFKGVKMLHIRPNVNTLCELLGV